MSKERPSTEWNENPVLGSSTGGPSPSCTACSSAASGSAATNEPSMSSGSAPARGGAPLIWVPQRCNSSQVTPASRCVPSENVRFRIEGGTPIRRRVLSTRCGARSSSRPHRVRRVADRTAADGRSIAQRRPVSMTWTTRTVVGAIGHLLGRSRTVRGWDERVHGGA